MVRDAFELLDSAGIDIDTFSELQFEEQYKIIEDIKYERLEKAREEFVRVLSDV